MCLCLATTDTLRQWIPSSSLHHLHTFPQHLRTVFRNLVIHRRGPWQCLGKRGVLCAIHSLHDALYYPNKNVIVFGPKDFGSGACNIAIKPPGAAIQKRSGGCKVLGAEDARCEQDPRPSDFDPQENSQDVRAALGLKCIYLATGLLADGEQSWGILSVIGPDVTTLAYRVDQSPRPSTLFVPESLPNHYRPCIFQTSSAHPRPATPTITLFFPSASCFGALPGSLAAPDGTSWRT